MDTKKVVDEIISTGKEHLNVRADALDTREYKEELEGILTENEKMNTKNFFKERQCLNGICDHCQKETTDEEGEILVEAPMRLVMDDGHAYDTVLGEWCSTECFIADMKEKLRKAET